MSFFQVLWITIVNFIRYFQRIEIKDPEHHLVLITGCDSGFGLMTAQKLLKMGYYVVALCLTEKGVSELTEFAKEKGYKNSLVLRCDVTKEEDLKRVYEKVESTLKADTKRKLWAVVNNAGIAPSGFADWLSLGTFRLTMEVNFFAIVSICQLFLPLLKPTKNSRIINISSMAGLVGGPLGAPYCASKHAIEGFVKSLRTELFPWNIYVTNINPGYMKTGIVEKSEEFRMKDWQERVSQEMRDQYPFHNLTAGNAAMKSVEEDPMYVVDCIIDNLTIAAPVLNNFPGINTKIAAWADWATLGVFKHLFDIALVRSFNYGPYPEVVKKFQEGERAGQKTEKKD